MIYIHFIVDVGTAEDDRLLVAGFVSCLISWIPAPIHRFAGTVPPDLVTVPSDVEGTSASDELIPDA